MTDGMAKRCPRFSYIRYYGHTNGIIRRDSATKMLDSSFDTPANVFIFTLSHSTSWRHVDEIPSDLFACTYQKLRSLTPILIAFCDTNVVLSRSQGRGI